MIKKINIFLVLLLLILSISAVSAASDANNDMMSTNGTISDSSDKILSGDVENNELLTSSSHVVTSSNYNDYFNSKGRLIPSAVNAGDTLEIDGSFSGKEFKLDKTVNIVGTDTNDMKDCVFTFYNGASGSTISNLKIANTQDGKYGIFLNNASNCVIQGCIINNTGMSSYDICVANDAMYNNVSNNVLTAYGITYGHGTRSTPPLLLSDAHYNYIGDNVITCDDANAIYLSSYAGGPLTGGESYFNTIHNNVITYNVLPTSWAYGIQVMGSNNTISSNRITGAYRGVSTMNPGNVIVDNWIINLTGADFNNPGVPSGGEIAIVGSSDSTIKNNHIVNAKVISTGAGITALGNSIVENNYVDVSLQGKGIQPKGSNIIIKNNTIITDSGSGILYNVKAFNLEVLDNNISSKTGIGVLIQKEKDKKLPGNITIVGNTIATDNTYAIDAAEADPNSTLIIGINNIKRGCLVRTPDGTYNPSEPGDTVIVAQDVVTSYKSDDNMVATLKDVDGGAVRGAEVKILFNGAVETLTTDGNGQVSLPLNNVKPGSYLAVIAFDGNVFYEKSNATANVVVNKADTIISAPDVTVAYKDSEGMLAATVVNEHGKPLVVNLNFNFNGKDYTVRTDSEGKASIAIGTLSPGTYAATVSYKGSGNYRASSATADVQVTKAATVISAPDVSVAYKDPNGELVATIINEHGKPLVVTLNVNLNGKTYAVKTDSNGQASIPIGTLSPGTYAATVSYKGSSNYKASTAAVKVTVSKAATVIAAPDVDVAYKDPNGELVATIISEHGKPLVVTLNVNLNGKTYSVKTDSNGQASIPIGTLSPGTYAATVSYKGSSNYEASTAAVKVTVSKAATVIAAPDVDVAYKDPNGELVATIISEHGKPLVVTLNVELNGKTYSVKTDSNGQASIPIGTLSPGAYTATVSYKGSSNYKASTVAVKVTVSKAATVITAPDVNIAYKDPNGELVATIISEHGKPLVVTLNVNINGKDYTVKTDSNGQAFIPVGTLTPGTYTATISYKGSGNYKASSTTAKVTVAKAATIITAPDVTVAYNDPNGKLISTIVNEHGKPLVVTMNVDLNGKTYSVKTDSNGQASVSTADLAPGTYTATISYKGSSNYNASSTTAKIQVK